MYTLDTNVIIYYLSGLPEAVRFIDGLIAGDNPILISVYTEVELFSYPRLTSVEADRIEAILNTVTIIPLGSNIARRAAYCSRMFLTNTGDSIIAATALDTKTTLATRNVKDFKNIPNLTLQRI